MDQDPATQVAALEAAGCTRVYVERASGRRVERPELAAALEYLRAGDQLVVCRLDRLGRNLPHLLALLDQLHDRGVQFRSLGEGMDTTTAQGQLLYALLGAFAAFERELIRERTRDGLAAARALGRRGGRPKVLTVHQVRYARRMHDAGVSITEIAKGLSCGRTTVYRALIAADG
jgi:DNA invertase Pin-like site-specific DNA recombinase